jgi:YggT family protein
VNVGWFLVVGVAVAGILLLTVAEWGLGALGTMMAATAGGPRGFAWVLVNLAYTLTDWLVEPLRRVIPPLGAIDLTPLIAWLVLMVGRRILGGILF